MQKGKPERPIVSANINFHNPELIERFERLEQKIDALNLVLAKQTKPEVDELVPQFTAIALLKTTFHTYKIWCKEFGVKIQTKGGRAFIKRSDLTKLMTKGK